ncbi:MAG: Gfo/Idh/MocA family oxidoreductase [Acidobacteriota bacterium]
MEKVAGKDSLTRREFLKETTYASAGAAVLGGLAPARALGANNRIRIGVLGSGERAQYLASIFVKQPSVEIVAVCDVYEPHLRGGLKIAGKGATGTSDYRTVLDRKDIDAVVIGAPNHWHKQMLVEAVRAGKDAYCEKPIIHSIPEGQEILQAVNATHRVVQTGTQQRSWPHFILGKQLVDSGMLGDVTFVHTYWYQNYYTHQGWNGLFKVDEAQLNWKQWLGDAPSQPFTAEKFVWWRFYWDFGGGILTDLLTHWIDVIQWYMKQPAPKTATTTGDLYLMNWQCPDTITAVYEYPRKFMVSFTGALCNGIDDGGIVFRGTKGALKINRARLAFFPQGEKWEPGTRHPKPEILAESLHDGTIEHIQNFLDCVRTRKTPNAPVEVGFEAARSSWIGNLAFKAGKRLVWDAAKGEPVAS